MKTRIHPWTTGARGRGRGAGVIIITITTIPHPHPDGAAAAQRDPQTQIAQLEEAAEPNAYEMVPSGKKGKGKRKSTVVRRSTSSVSSPSWPMYALPDPALLAPYRGFGSRPSVASCGDVPGTLRCHPSAPQAAPAPPSSAVPRARQSHLLHRPARAPAPAPPYVHLPHAHRPPHLRAAPRSLPGARRDALMVLRARVRGAGEVRRA
ncbi:hypothetical protein B0H14DRAFT_3455409 [Mycena olivaceomarginata]|nr:hypothetical protein B0H14DRAFT_3455409 [Mycena olivaceomarginata]